MEIKKYVSWRRVSTFRQQRSGLGLEAQKEIIRYFIERDKGILIADYSECYTGKELGGCVELRKAMEHAKKDNATLIIAKSDRFRNCQEALGILDEMKGKVEFCDIPHTDRFTLTLFFALAEREALIVSIRTKQALAAKKARGEATGGDSKKWQETWYSKSQLEREKIQMEKGKLRRERHHESRDMVVFEKILRKVFLSETIDREPHDWEWQYINCKEENRVKILTLMRDYAEMDDTGNTFRKWDFSDAEIESNGHTAVRLRSFVQSFRRSYKRA